MTRDHRLFRPLHARRSSRTWVLHPALLFALGLALCLCTVPALSPANADGAGPVPPEVAQKFETFVQRWVSICQAEFAGTRNCTLLIEEKDGFTQRFMEIDHSSISWRIKPTQNERTPFVGVLSYVMNTYVSRAATREQVVVTPFRHVSKRKVTEIFRYSDGRWQE